MGAEENERAVREIFKCWNREDIQGALAYLDPECELLPVRAQLEGIVYRGHAGARRLYEDIVEEWESMTFEVEAIRASGDRVLAHTILRGRGRVSGVEPEVAIGWVLRFRDGLVLRSRAYSNPDEAERAFGA